MMILFIMVVALIEYQSEALDYAVEKAARQIMTGQAQKQAVGQSAFRTQMLCPYLPAAMNCSNVIISVQTVTPGAQPSGYYTLVNTTATQLVLPTMTVDAGPYSLGIQYSYEYLIVVYPVTFIPSFFARILGGGTTYMGLPAYLLVSTVAFKNEPYS